MKLHPLVQKSKEWIDFRRSHICASDAPVIMQMSPFKDIDQLYKEKKQGFEQVANPYMQRGIDLEPIALEKFEQETGLIMFPCVATHEDKEWMAASFDGVTICRTAICEIKCPGRRDHSTALEGKVPQKYLAQIYHQLEVSGLQMAYYYSFDGEKGVIIEIKRDNDFIEIMLEKEYAFWQRLQVLTESKV